MAGMPAEHRFGFRKRRQVFCRDKAAGCDAAQVGEDEIVAAFEGLGSFGRNARREQGHAIAKPEEDVLARWRQARGFHQRERRVVAAAHLCATR